MPGTQDAFDKCVLLLAILTVFNRNGRVTQKTGATQHILLALGRSCPHPSLSKHINTVVLNLRRSSIRDNCPMAFICLTEQ